MAQRVAFESIPATRFDQYIFKLRLVLGYLNQPGGTKFKGFRDFMRKQNLWDKDKSEIVFSAIELTWDKNHVKLGKTAKRLLSAHSDSDFQNVLFERMKELNLLLVKYVLEALDVTQGGRLHSVHELYRMITSYVYPGTYITLTSFQAWIDWVAASGYIKLVGIRWALSDKGQKVVNELRSMDVDEIMEDMEDEGEGEGADAGEDEEAAEEDDDEAATPAPSAVAPSKFAKPALPQPAPPKAAAKPATKDDVDDEEDLFADLPPEAEAPDEEAVKAASARLGLEEDDDDDDAAAPPKPMAPKYTPPASLMPKGRGDKGAAQKPQKPTGASELTTAQARAGAPAVAIAAAPGGAGLHAPLPTVGYAVVPVSALGGAGEAELVDRVVGLWQALGEWPAFTADRLGVVHQQGAGDLALLIELGVIAALIEGLEPQPQVFAFLRRLRETTFFASLGHGEGLEEGLDALERTSNEPWARPLFERLVHARFVARRVGMKIDLLYQLRQAASGREVVQLLREHLTGPHWVEAPFWVARELVRLGLLKDAQLKTAIAVPTRRLVQNAASIGLAKVSELRDFESLLALSEAVSALFGSPEAGYGEALAQLDRGLGLTV